MATDFFSDLAKQRGQDVRRLGRQRQQYEGTLMRAAATKATQDAKWNLRIADRSYMQALNRDRMQQDFALQRGAQEIGARREAATTERGFRREEAGAEREFRTGEAGTEREFRREEGALGRALPREEFEARETRLASERAMWKKLAPVAAEVSGVAWPEGLVPDEKGIGMMVALGTIQRKGVEKDLQDAARADLAQHLDPDIAKLTTAGRIDADRAVMIQLDRDNQQRQQGQRTRERKEDVELRATERAQQRNDALQAHIWATQAQATQMLTQSWSAMTDDQRDDYKNAAGEADFATYVEKVGPGQLDALGVPELNLILRARNGDAEAQAELDRNNVPWH